jgi:hypothetical protein
VRQALTLEQNFSIGQHRTETPRSDSTQRAPELSSTSSVEETPVRGDSWIWSEYSTVLFLALRRRYTPDEATSPNSTRHV